jgi:hypothetical protein
MRGRFPYVHVRRSIWNARPKPTATAVPSKACDPTTSAANPIANDPEAAAIALLVRLSPDDLDALSKKNIKEFFALGTRATERVLTKAREDRGKSSQADPGRKSESRRAAALSRLKSLQCRD